MSWRKGKHREDAIVLDDDDSDEPDFVDLAYYQPSVKASPLPTGSETEDVPWDDDDVVFCGEVFKEPVKSSTELAARYDKGRKAVCVSISPEVKQKTSSFDFDPTESFTVSIPVPSQAPTARMYTPFDEHEPSSPTNAKLSSLKLPTEDIQQAIECPPQPTGTTEFPEQEQDTISLETSQPTEKATANSPCSGRECPVKKSGTLAERMGSGPLPVVTSHQGRPMGFAAMPSAKDDPRYAYLAGVKEANTASPANTAIASAGIAKKNFPVATKAVHAPSRPVKAPAKPPAKKAPPKKPDPPPPSLDILKPGRKRPLSEIGAFELFTPKQIISQAGWEAKKRQRLEKKQDRVLEDGTALNQGQKGQNKGECDLDGLPDVLELDNYERLDPIRADSEAAPNLADAVYSELPVAIGSSPLQMGEIPDALPSKLPDTTATDHLATSDQGNDQAATAYVGINAHEIDNAQVIPEPQVPCIEVLESIARQPVPPKQLAIERKIHSNIPAPIVEPNKQGIPDPKPQRRQSAPPEKPAIKPQYQPPNTRPTTAGKGISPATLAVWQATEAEDVPHTTSYHADQLDDDLISITEPVYEYHVHRREWLIEEAEGECEPTIAEQVLGPYHTIEEANHTAQKEVRYPVQYGTTQGIQSKAWDYTFRQDQDSLQIHSAEAAGLHIEAQVQRELAPPDDRLSFPVSAFKVTPRVYLVQELSYFPTSTYAPTPTATPPAPAAPYCETFTHACCTTLDGANKKAADQWLAAYTGAWSDFRAEGRKKDEIEKALKFDLKELKEGRECFHREVEFAKGAMCKIWVVECEVEGPRN